MLRERLQRAKDALKNSDLDALFVFRTEDARYLMGYRHHLGPAFIMGNAVTVLARNHEPIGRTGRRSGRFARRKASRHRHLGYQHGERHSRSISEDGIRRWISKRA